MGKCEPNVLKSITITVHFTSQCVSVCMSASERELSVCQCKEANPNNGELVPCSAQRKNNKEFRKESLL